jgi:hypothetical protein
MSEQPTKQELLVSIKKSWDELNQVIANLSEEQMTQPGVQDDWTVKDIMAHISAWKRLAMDRIHAAATGADLQFPVIKGEEFVDTFNAEVYQRFKDQALEKVRAEFQAANAEFLAQIEALDEDLFYETLPFDWAGNLTYQVLISANTHWHYPDHIEAILKWLDKQDSQNV